MMNYNLMSKDDEAGIDFLKYLLSDAFWGLFAAFVVPILLVLVLFIAKIF